jgi:phosphoglycolate phosphatase-like HAD superfamily hydrolase
MQVLLFDIDGTLIRSGGAGKAAMENALRSEFGLTDLNDSVPYSGRTDPSIGRDLLNIHGLDACEANIHRLRDAYLRHLPESLRKHEGIVLPGIRELLDRLQGAEKIAVGLLTGNIRDGARCKLSHYGLWDYFPFGAFADGIHDRDDVARGALVEVARHTKREIHPSSIWVIGDTPLDVKCARAIGAKAVAVATGWHPVEELEASGADWVLSDLSEPARLLHSWGVQ